MRKAQRAGTVGVLATLAAALLWLAIEPRIAGGTERLTNPGFEQWPLAGWNVTGTASASTAPARTGTAAQIEGSTYADIYQFVEGVADATYAAGIYVTTDTQRPATLRMSFLDSGFVVIATVEETKLIGSAGFQALNVSANAPPGTAWVEFRLMVNAGANPGTLAWVDDASLTETVVVPPTSTATSTPVSTATPTFVANPTATPTAVPTATPVPATSIPTTTPVPDTSVPTTVSPPPTATRTNTPSPTQPTSNTPTSPSPPGAPPATTTPRTPTATATPVNTPTAAPPAATTTPELPAFGGLLRNGNFEAVTSGAPEHWQRQGGTLRVTDESYHGDWAASHLSVTSSTKWIHQATPVTGGSWYSASAWARVQTGSAELFIRVSWYASADGSGSLVSQVDSPLSTSAGWTHLTTGAVRAPANARSARVRLMLRPFGPTAGAWDDAVFVASPAATPTPVPTAVPTSPGGGGPRGGSATATPRPGSSGPGGSSASGGSAGGGSGGGSSSVAVQGGEPPRGGSLLLSEIMSDPDVQGDNNLNEWVEVYNAGGAPIDLRGWIIADRSRGSVLGSLVVGPDEYAIIAARDTIVPDGVTYTRVPAGRIGFGLRNPGDAVLLYAPDGTLVDAMSYGDIDLYGPGQPDAPPKGETLGRAFDGDGEPGPWMLTLRPTPGEPNVFPEIEPEAGDDAGTQDDASDDRREPATATAPATGEARPGGAERADPRVEDSNGTSPIAWMVLGGAIVAALAGGTPYLRSAWGRVKEVRKRGS